MATLAGLWLMLAYPLLILAYDAALKLSGRPTITAKVSSTPELRAAVVIYLSLFTVALGLHFGLGWLDGYPPAP